MIKNVDYFCRFRHLINKGSLNIFDVPDGAAPTDESFSLPRDLNIASSIGELGTSHYYFQDGCLM